MAQLSPALTEEEFEEYELSGEPDWFSSRTFRVDFTRPWLTCSYNLEARGFFARDLLKSIAGGSYRSSNVPARYITSEHITAALDTYMETCREHYRDIAAPP